MYLLARLTTTRQNVRESETKSPCVGCSESSHDEESTKTEIPDEFESSDEERLNALCVEEESGIRDEGESWRREGDVRLGSFMIWRMRNEKWIEFMLKQVNDIHFRMSVTFFQPNRFVTLKFMGLFQVIRYAFFLRHVPTTGLVCLPFCSQPRHRMMKP